MGPILWTPYNTTWMGVGYAGPINAPNTFGALMWPLLWVKFSEVLTEDFVHYHVDGGGLRGPN